MHALFSGHYELFAFFLVGLSRSRNNDNYYGYYDYYPEKNSYHNDHFKEDQYYHDFSYDTEDHVVFEYEYIVEEISGVPSRTLSSTTQRFNKRLGTFYVDPTSSSISNGNRRQNEPTRRQFLVNPAQLLFFSFGMVFGKNEL